MLLRRISKAIQKSSLGLLLLLATSTSSFSQGYIEYYNLVAEAEWRYDNSEFDQAEALYLEAFDLEITPKWKDCKLYGKILENKDQQKKAFKFLKRHLKKSGGSYYDITKDLKWSFLFSDKQVAKLNDIKIDTLSKEYKETIELNSILDRLCQEDQKIRNAVDHLGDEFSDSVIWVSNGDTTIENKFDLSQTITNFNDSILTSLIFSGQLLNCDRINNVDISLLLLHMPYEHFRNIEIDLLSMIDNGILDPFHFACAKDRKYTENGDCISYFAYLITGEGLLDCISYEDMLLNRKDIGLSPYYRRTSTTRHISVNKQMKFPMKEYFLKHSK